MKNNIIAFLLLFVLLLFGCSIDEGTNTIENKNNLSSNIKQEDTHSEIKNDESGIPDKNLYNALLKNAGTDKLYFDSLKDLKDLSLNSSKINDLTGIDKLDLNNVTNALLYGNNLKIIEKHHFSNMKNVENLIVSNNDLEKFDTGILNKLTILDLANNNKLKLLSNCNLQNYPDIEELYIGRCIKEPVVAFPSMPNLKILFAHSIGMELINKNTFAKLPSIEVLVLLDNEISDIEAGSFDALSNLQRLHLANNKISDLTGVFDNTNSIITITLNKNNLTSLPDMKHMTNLMWEYGKIHEYGQTRFNENSIPEDELRNKLPAQLLDDEELLKEQIESQI